MYAKLVFRNAKRSVKDYLVYIVTMTICVTLFYAFLSISSSYYSPDIGSEYDFIQTISAEISAYIGFSTLMLQIGATMGILAILLICYFISTWIIFRRSVNP